MDIRFTRRTALEILGAGALAPVASFPTSSSQVPPAPKEGKDTPKIALGMADGGGVRGTQSGAGPNAPTLDPEAAPRRIKQLGVDHVLGSGGPVPWTEAGLRNTMERWNAAGITVGNLMIGLTPEILYGKARRKRDEDIEKIRQSIIAAGRVGLPVIEYNFYAHHAPGGHVIGPAPKIGCGIAMGAGGPTRARGLTHGSACAPRARTALAAMPQVAAGSRDPPLFRKRSG